MTAVSSYIGRLAYTNTNDLVLYRHIPTYDEAYFDGIAVEGGTVLLITAFYVLRKINLYRVVSCNGQGWLEEECMTMM